MTLIANLSAGPVSSQTAATANIRLRTTAEAELDYVLDAETASENHAFVTQWTRDQHREALGSADQRHLIIESIPEGRRVGYILLAGLTNEHHSIEFRRIVVTEKGQGFGREAFRLIKEFAFTKLFANRLWLDVKEHNVPARRLYESEGFISEGILRECTKTESGYESLVIMSMLRSEYLGEVKR